jgi:hypothetical protein
MCLYAEYNDPKCEFGLDDAFIDFVRGYGGEPSGSGTFLVPPFPRELEAVFDAGHLTESEMTTIKAELHDLGFHDVEFVPIDEDGERIEMEGAN